MLLFDFLRGQDSTVTPETSKGHLACCYGHQNLLNIYYRGAV
jgi:hypothetical protein